jgi:hypothetical protein
VTASIFGTTFNPTGARTGNKILRQRLKGEALKDYYLPKLVSIKMLRKQWPDMDFVDEDEEMRLENVERYVWIVPGGNWDEWRRGLGIWLRMRKSRIRDHGKRRNSGAFRGFERTAANVFFSYRAKSRGKGAPKKVRVKPEKRSKK